MDPRAGSGADRTPTGGAEWSAGDGTPAGNGDTTKARSSPDGNSAADLLRGIATDASILVRQEVMLAKQELTEGLTQTAKAGSVLAAAGVVGVFAVAFLLTTLAWILVAVGLPTWAGFGIVALVLLIVAAVAGWIGMRQMQQAKPAPERAQAQLTQTTQNLKSEAQATAQAVQAELRTTVQEAQTEAKSLPARLRSRSTRYTGQARAQIQRRVEETRRGRGHDGG